MSLVFDLIGNILGMITFGIPYLVLKVIIDVYRAVNKK